MRLMLVHRRRAGAIDLLHDVGLLAVILPELAMANQSGEVTATGRAGDDAWLAALDAPGLPIWTRQMPAFVLAKVGAKEAARDLMEAILEDPNVPPEEQEFMRAFIDERLK